MFLLATAASGAVAVAASDTLARASEVPELASMALLSVVLAVVSVAVRRSGAKPDADKRLAASRDSKQQA